MSTHKQNLKNYRPPGETSEIVVSTNLSKILRIGNEVSIAVEMLIDTDADISFIPKNIIKQLEELAGLKLPYDFQKVEDLDGIQSEYKVFELIVLPNNKGFGKGRTANFLEIDDKVGILGKDILKAEDYFESKLREAIFNKFYEEGKNYLLEVINHAKDRERRLKNEFGYIYRDLEIPIEEEKVTWKQQEVQIEWRRKVWQIMSMHNNPEMEILAEEEKEIDSNIGTEVTEKNGVRSKVPSEKTGVKRKISKKKGEELEKAVLKLFEHFLTMCVEDDDFDIIEKRKQKGGSQDGYDIKFVCEIKGNRRLRILVECKYYSQHVKKKDIGEKLIEAEAYHEEIPIDHWILISPNADVTNDLDKLLESWEEKGKYPFKIQFWTPETKVDEFFGLFPEVYDQIIGKTDGENHPRNWKKEKKQEVLEFWKRKIAPPIRLPKGWEKYLRNNDKLLLDGEKKDLFEDLYGQYVTMMCRDETGTTLNRTLEEKVLEWLEQPLNKSPTLFLLGDFGDGKTFFTYVLCRHLVEDFLKSPSTGWIPVRFALKDFGMKRDDITRDFVRRRLEEFGADIDGWMTLKNNNYKLLAILDGFDEMSRELDTDTIKANIENLIACYLKDFKGVKLLITSRKHFFEYQTEKDRLLSRIGEPQLLHVAPINRKTTERYLKDFARKIGAEDKFMKLKDIHDPIGMASKPLFLDMVQTSLKDLPDDDFNEFILYETYIKNALEHKVEFLEDKELKTSRKDIIENLKNILEDVALEIHESNKAFVYLSEIRHSTKFAGYLWEITKMEDRIKEDAKARITTRSLLKQMGNDDESQGKKWPVDFCHRSMREYFVARKICKLLRKKDISEAERFLRLYGLNYEIVYFTGQIMQNTDFEYEDSLMELIEKTRNLDKEAKLDARRLGGNAVNLLYQYKGELPKPDWSNLVLDGANLAEADLSGKNFSNTSLVSANLDNVNFENSDFSYCNLTNVRIEETTPIQAVSVSPDENLYALYNDGIIREWIYQRVRSPHAVSFTEDENKKAVKIFAYPENALTVIDDNQLIFYDKVDKKLKQKAVFEITSNRKLLNVSQNSLLLVEENVDLDVLKLFDLESQRVAIQLEIPKNSLCSHLDKDGFIIYNEKKGLQIIDMTRKQKPTIDVQIQSKEKITCLTTYRCKEPLKEYRLGIGLNSGFVQVWKIKLPKFEPKLLLKHKSHKETVKDIAFIDEERIISGGFDRILQLLTFNSVGEFKYDPKEFKIRLRCKGMKIEDVEREQERKLLEEFISKAR